MTRTLHVQIGKKPDRSNLEETFEALDAADEEPAESADPTLSVENLETFGRLFRPTNLELLEAIAEHQPESIRELARLVDRHPPDVLDNVTELEDYGLIELEEHGRSKRPVIWYDEIDADIPLSAEPA